MLSESEVLDILRRAVVAEGGQRPWARKHGVSRGLVSMILSGDRVITAQVLNVLGLSRKVVYERNCNRETMIG